MKKQLFLTKKKFALFLIFICFAAALFFGYTFYQNNVLSCTSYEIADEKLHPDLDGLRIVQISDFHNTHSLMLQRDIEEEIKKVSPDIIVITGDFIDCRRTDTESALKYAELLLEYAPVYMSAGNHEAAAYTEYPAFERKLISHGIRVLRNQAVTFSKGSGEINIIGIDDPVFSSEDNKFLHTENAIKRISFNKDNFTLALAHRPEVFSEYEKAQLDLVLSGHAHGGQIRLPFIGGLFTPTEGLFPKYSEGIHIKNDTTMIVSRGIGSSVFPFRINNRPELITITLKCG